MTKLIVAFRNFLNAHENCSMFRRPQGVYNEKEYSNK